ncbi:S-layer protein [Methanofervidicoccus sp. A16]|uniref:S-layer protein n=1 Tax=Methanofervidicoccus sp. A16 TaxID=2607662 RepID=UPI001189A295|nr:S-layer protein [Methanofervidicoccus sp. A16]AXI25477.1 S-layer protein [Methanofervidicoccus sp. A16]
MAMSLKKITAIAVGGAMVASTLASGVAASVVTIGDVEGFMKNVVKDGQPNVEIVVGSKAAAMDVVSAADIAAKIGSMCYKDATIEDGSVCLKFTVSADTETSDKLTPNPNFGQDEYMLILTTPKRSYTESLRNNNNIDTLKNLVGDKGDLIDNKIARLSTLITDSDADPDDIGKNDDIKKADTIEFLLAAVKNDSSTGFTIEKNGLAYGTLMFKDGKKDTQNLQALCIGMEMPFLGEIYRIVDIDEDVIYLGKEAYSGNVKEGSTIDVGNGYQVKVESVLQPVVGGTDSEVTIKVIKDGEVVTSKSQKVPFEFVYKDIGVIVYDTYKDISETYGYASLIITKDVKEYELGEEFVKDWKLYAITTDNNDNLLAIDNEDFDEIEDTNICKTKYLKIGNDELYGLALIYEGDKYEKLGKGDSVDFVNDYATLEFTDDDEPNNLYAKYKMEVSKEVPLTIGEKVEVLNAKLKLKDIKATAQQVVPIKTPIAKLDTEASLDTDKYLILVGGPVANKLSEELQNEGKINIDNDSPATLQVVDDKILVVAGGDRERTREAALYLIENY